MIIRATSKLLKISGIKPVKNEWKSEEIFPGEWYGNSLKTGHAGKLYILLFHNTTKISIICPPKSINAALKLLPERVENFLVRHRFESFLDKLELESIYSIYTTNDRSTLSFMNQIAYNAEWHLSNSQPLEICNLESLEDIHSDYLFSKKGKVGHYETTLDILNKIHKTLNETTGSETK